MTLNTPPSTDGLAGSNEPLTLSVRDAFFRYDPLRMWADRVDIQASGNSVVLTGIVRSETTSEQAENIARSVGGVSAVTNHLFVDAEIEVAAAQALGADPRTQSAFPGILVGVVFGTVYLKGRVTCAECKTAAGEIAGKIPGVLSVSNELAVDPN